MNKLYNKIYNAVNEGIQKALLIDPEQNDVSINYTYHKIDNYFEPLQNEFIDLGLPSGTLWCDHNLGATCKNTAASWFGEQYAWGEINTHNQDCRWQYYQWTNKNESDLKFSKYVNNPKYGECDNLQILQKNDDIAYIEYFKKFPNSKIANNCRIPSVEQYNELLDNTDMQHVLKYQNIQNLEGFTFTSKINGKHIFIPMTTSFDFYLWTNQLHNENNDLAYDFSYFDQYIGITHCVRNANNNIRPVSHY